MFIRELRVCHCRKQLEGFLHVWRATAYFMGVDDEANLVKDDMNRTKYLLCDIVHFILVPALLDMNKVSIVMGKNVAKALDADYHVLVYIAMEGFLADAKPIFKLWKAFSILQKLKYFWFKYLMGQLYYFTLFRRSMNKLTHFFNIRNIAKARG